MADGARVRCAGERAWMVGRGPKVAALLDHDEEAAAVLLADHLAGIGPGESVELLFVTSGQDWAVQAGLEAGLALTPDGPVFTRGTLGIASRVGSVGRVPGSMQTSVNTPRAASNASTTTGSKWVPRAALELSPPPRRHRACGRGGR